MLLTFLGASERGRKNAKTRNGNRLPGPVPGSDRRPGEDQPHPGLQAEGRLSGRPQTAPHRQGQSHTGQVRKGKGSLCAKGTHLYSKWKRKEGNVLFNDALNTFYLWLYCVRYMVKDHSDSERGNLLPPHRLLFPINSKGSFICIIPQTG